MSSPAQGLLLVTSQGGRNWARAMRNAKTLKGALDPTHSRQHTVTDSELLKGLARLHGLDGKLALPSLLKYMHVMWAGSCL
jgi:hypothetical protein